MSDASERDAPELAPVPPLPRKLTDLRPVAFIGIGAWLVAFLVLCVLGERGEWFWVTLYGTVGGMLFFGLSEWQRAAAKRGSRGAQTGFDTDESPQTRS
ncbi:DUF2530 domain-containing protein [Sciscionella marina]|uniref:DUF2530 domain-containing protein n=1 Tax=Sciscionella marina TaxID=508770 RepID=UPI001F08D011|nr:DUF2530 domain-containing protein [Sciscionella marina]